MGGEESAEERVKAEDDTGQGSAVSEDGWGEHMGAH